MPLSRKRTSLSLLFSSQESFRRIEKEKYQGIHYKLDLDRQIFRLSRVISRSQNLNDSIEVH